MIGKIDGQLIFCYTCPETKIKKRRNKNRYVLSLLSILMGIFLLPQIAFLSSITSENLIKLTNKEREALGINRVTANQLLTKAAYDKANAILATQTFAHNIDDKKFSSWVRDAEYDYSYVGENLAIDFTTSEGVIRAWKNSELHNKNLLNPRFTEIGIASLEGKFKGNDTTVIVQIFAEPKEIIGSGKISGVESNDLDEQASIEKALATETEKNLSPIAIQNQKNNLLLSSKLAVSNIPLNYSNTFNPPKLSSYSRHAYEYSILNVMIITSTIITFLSILYLCLLFLIFIIKAIHKTFNLHKPVRLLKHT